MRHHSPIGEPFRNEPLVHNTLNQATGGIWRVHGPDGTAIRKEAVRGTAGPPRWRTSDDPRHWNYWRREYLAYRDGLPELLCGDSGLRPPRLLRIDEETDAATLWIEDVDGVPGFEWSVPRLGLFARQLGRAQARHVDAVPDRPWLSTGWLRQYTATMDFSESIDWDHPVAARTWSAELRGGLVELWRRQSTLHDRAATLPRTLCHLDVWPMNFVADGENTVLFDWAFVGDGALGEDIGNLIPDTVADGWVNAKLLPEIIETVTDAYLAGLADAGWHGDDGAVRTAIAVTGAAKYAWIAPMMLHRLAADAPVGSTNYDTRDDADQILAERVPMLELISSWARTALT